MILFFSGTGNTRHVARSLSNLLDDKIYFIPDTPAKSITEENERLIFCFPVYSWGVPPIVLDYINSLEEDFISHIRRMNVSVIMVCTCGDEVAETPEMFSKAWEKRGVAVRGLWNVIMPNDYVLLPGFNVDDAETEQRKLDSSEVRIREIARKILAEEWERDVIRGTMPRLKSRLVYPLFKRWGINPRHWTVSQECVSCGRCAEVCPVRNITLVQGRPKWGTDCVSCTACFHHCPTHAIDYGKVTENKGQYFCHLQPLKKK